MKKSLLIPLFTFTFCLHLSAAVPLKWTVETSRATPATFEAYQGETLELEAALQSYGKPLEASGIAALYWQTNGMGSAYWEATAAVNSNRLSAVWTPEMDVGAKSYNCFIGVPGTVYHAAFQLRLRPSPGALPNELPLPQKVIDFAKVTVLNPPWSSGGGVDTNAVLGLIAPATNRLYKTLIDAKDGAARPLPKYLWLYNADDSYPDAAAEYYRQRLDFGGCSAVRSGGFLYRNFDYPFDDRAEFVVKMSAGKGRFASVGVAQVGTNLTEQIVTSGKPSRYYKALPGATVDGINENGVVAEINVVDGEPQWEGGASPALHPLAAVRWALDHATNAEHAATYLAAHIAFPEGWTQNFHYMIADADGTWIIEDGMVHCEYGGPSVMTNFKLYTEDTPSGEGLERYYALMGGANITNAWYTRAYRRETNPPWVSDLAEVIDYTNDIFNAWAEHPKEYFRGKTNNGVPWWQTVHTSVYDITNRVLRIAVQEVDDWYVFQMPSAGGTDEAKVRSIAAEVVAPVAARKGSDITTGEGEIVIGSIETDPDISIADNIVILDHANSSQNTSISRLETNLQRKANKSDVLSLDGGTITGDLDVTGDFDAGGEASFGGNVIVGANRLYIGDSVFESILRDYTLTRVFEEHRDDANVHVTAAQKSGWNASISALQSATNALQSQVSGLESSKADKAMISATNPAFSNAVLAVQIDTNLVANIGELREFFDGLPVGTVGTSLGGVILALLAAAAYLKKKTALLDNEGKATDDFATDLLAKPVAITAIDARIKTNAESAAEPTNTVTINDNAPKTVTVATVESPATPSLAVTFGTARNGGLRICELYILNGTADTDLTFDSAVHFVATGDSFPACEAGINYFVFAEVAANLWKVTRETLKSITTPTPVAAA